MSNGNGIFRPYLHHFPRAISQLAKLDDAGGSGDFQEDGDFHVVKHLRAQDEEHRREAGGPETKGESCATIAGIGDEHLRTRRMWLWVQMGHPNYPNFGSEAPQRMT